MHNRHYNTRYERLQARRAIVIGQPRVSSNHFHTCECRACWSCTEPKCSAFHQKKQKCVQCIKREQELNSGEQQKLNFEPVYAQHSDFMNFNDMKFHSGNFIVQPFAVDDIVKDCANSLAKAMGEALNNLLGESGWKAPEDLIKDSVKQ
jgi:hypothetical protein